MKNMKKKKGFTLIELLAVIVILAIIALIAVPIVLNLIERARKGSFQRSAEGVLKSAKTNYAASLLDPNGAQTIAYECNGTECVSQVTDENGNAYKLDVEGNVGSGTITIEDDGTIYFSLTNGTYCAYKSADMTKIETKDGNCDDVDVTNDTTPPVVSVISSTSDASSIKVTFSATEDISVVKSVTCSATGGGTTKTGTVTNNICTVNGLASSTEYTVNIEASNRDIVNDENRASAIGTVSTTVSTTAVSAPTISVVPSGNVWTQEKLVYIKYGETTYPTSDGTTAQYSTDGGTNWIDVTSEPIVVTVDPTSLAAKSIGSNGSESEFSNATVINIDRIAPTFNATPISTTVTSSSIQAVVNPITSASGVYAYKYNISNDDGATWLSLINPATGTHTDEWIHAVNGNVFTFSPLSPGTYKIKVEIMNNAYQVSSTSTNVTISGDADASLGTNSATTSASVSACPTPVITYDSDNYAQSKQVTIHFENNAENVAGCTLSYTVIKGVDTLGSGTATGDSATVTVSAEGATVTATNSDGVNTPIRKNETILKIDTTKPTVALATNNAEDDVVGGANAITISTLMNDSGSGLNVAGTTCEYGLTDAYGSTSNCTKTAGTATGNGTPVTVEISGLEVNTPYYYRVCAVDSVGNVSSTCLTGTASTAEPEAKDVIYKTAEENDGTPKSVQTALDELYEALS